MNPFNGAQFIRVGCNAAGFFIEIVPAGGHDLHIQCGSANACAEVLKANKVQHFDFLTSVMNNSNAFEAFAAGATACGFEF